MSNFLICQNEVMPNFLICRNEKKIKKISKNKYLKKNQKIHSQDNYTIIEGKQIINCATN
jgi:hypothetical protein